MRRVDLSAYQGTFQDHIRRYLSLHGMEQQKLSKRVGIQPIELSNLLTGKRKLSANYLMPFISGGIIKVADLYDGHEVSDKEKDCWTTMEVLENKDLPSNVGKMNYPASSYEVSQTPRNEASFREYDPKRLNKKPITVVLRGDTHAALVSMAKDESRPVAQMARVIIERAVNNKKGE